MKAPKQPSPASTLLVITVGFLVIYLLTGARWVLLTAVTFGVIGVVSPWLSGKISAVWMGLSVVLSKVVPPIILGIIYLIVLLPLAVMARAFRKDPLRLSPKYPSYFVEVNRRFEPKDLENLW
jgi:hypothetical protein